MTTPQRVAVSDVQRALNMLRKVDVPVLGLVENMAGFSDAQGNEHLIFGAGGGAAIAAKYDVPLLASIPLTMQISSDGDSGVPTALSASPAGALFRGLADKLVALTPAQHAAKSPLNVIK